MALVHSIRVLYTNNIVWSNGERERRKNEYSHIFVNRWIHFYSTEATQWKQKGRKWSETKHTHAHTPQNVIAEQRQQRISSIALFSTKIPMRLLFHPFNARPQHTSVNDADYWDPIKMSTLLLHRRNMQRQLSTATDVVHYLESRVWNEWEWRDDAKF